MIAVNPLAVATARAKVDEATLPKPVESKLPTARFALLAPPDTDTVALTAAVLAAFADDGARVAPLSPLDHRVLVLTFPRRLLRADEGPAFAATYALIDAFRLEGAEPELHTDFFPVPDTRRAGPANEGIDDFPPGCWAPPEPALDATRRWALEKIRIPAAWDWSTQQGKPSRGEGIVIAQPDTGVTDHPDIRGVVRASSYDLIDDDTDATDPLGYTGNPSHGTGTASVALAPEGSRISGSAPRARHIPIRTVQSVIRVSQVRVAQAIDFAVANGAHVVTMSLGGLPSISLQRALQRAIDKNLIVLAAAGNCVGTVVWPARYDDCIAIGGSTSDDTAWRGSCRGSDVDVSAPAQNVFRARSALATGGGLDTVVEQGQGTSFAVALTAGVAACWLAHHSRDAVIAAAQRQGISVQALFNRLLRISARKPTDWNTAKMGTGVVDALALLQTDLDFRIGSEGTFSTSAPPALGVRRLVLETSPGGAAAQSDIDWDRYGQEIALIALRRLKRPEPVARGLEAADAPPPAPSAELSRTLSEAPALRAALGLSSPPNPGE